jgi:hypothetical protein
VDTAVIGYTEAGRPTIIQGAEDTDLPVGPLLDRAGRDGRVVQTRFETSAVAANWTASARSRPG